VLFTTAALLGCDTFMGNSTNSSCKFFTMTRSHTYVSVESILHIEWLARHFTQASQRLLTSATQICNSPTNNELLQNLKEKTKEINSIFYPFIDAFIPMSMVRRMIEGPIRRTREGEWMGADKNSSRMRSRLQQDEHGFQHTSPTHYPSWPRPCSH
jgi:Rps23 Pro-64 3,4-dihydroxylase Tpa1-like proline 4-hydroxylase